jgi:hypothetical protein
LGPAGGWDVTEIARTMLEQPSSDADRTEAIELLERLRALSAFGLDLKMQRPDGRRPSQIFWRTLLSSQWRTPFGTGSAFP